MQSHVTTPCARCGEPGRHSFSDRADGEDLFWKEAFRCERCGEGYEADGWDRLPEELRQHVLVQHGHFGVEVVAVSTVEVLKALRRALDLSMAETAALKEQLPGPLFSGTRAEAQQKQNVLEAAGVESKIVSPD